MASTFGGCNRAPQPGNPLVLYTTPAGAVALVRRVFISNAGEQDWEYTITLKRACEECDPFIVRGVVLALANASELEGVSLAAGDSIEVASDGDGVCFTLSRQEVTA